MRTTAELDDCKSCGSSLCAWVTSCSTLVFKSTSYKKDPINPRLGRASTRETEIITIAETANKLAKHCPANPTTIDSVKLCEVVLPSSKESFPVHKK